MANAGILPMALGDPHASDFVDATDVDLLGVMNTVAVSLPHLPDGGSVIITADLPRAWMWPASHDNPVMRTAATAGCRCPSETLVQLPASRWPAPGGSVHPRSTPSTPPTATLICCAATPLQIFRPDLEHPCQEGRSPPSTSSQAMPIPYVEAGRHRAAAAALASGESPCITRASRSNVDAGSLLQDPQQPSRLAATTRRLDMARRTQSLHRAVLRPYDFDIRRQGHPVWKRLRDEAPLYYNDTATSTLEPVRAFDVTAVQHRLEHLRSPGRVRSSS